MTDQAKLWHHVVERLAAQAWSCDDASWPVRTVTGSTIGELLAAYADVSADDRAAASRALQNVSDARSTPPTLDAVAIVHAWLDLRRIDAALQRPPIDLRSDVAHFAGHYIVENVVGHIVGQGVGASIVVTGPGFTADVVDGPVDPRVTARLTWPMLIGLAAGTTSVAESDLDVVGPHDAMDTFSNAVTRLVRF